VKNRRLLILVPLLGILLISAGWFGLHFLVHSDAFCDWLSRKVSHSIHADGKFEPLTWEGSTFRSAGFSAQGGPRSKLRSIRVTDISAHVDWRQLLKGVFAIDLITVDKVDAVVGKNRGPIPPRPPPDHREPQQSSKVPIELKIEKLYSASTNIHWQTATGESGEFTETKLTATRTGPDQWDILTVGGTVRHATYPALQVDQLHASVTQDSVSILDANTSVAGGGEIAINGKISTEKQLSAQLNFEFSGLEFNPFVPTDWRIGGKVSGQLTYTGDFDRFEHGEVAGSVKIDGATFDMTNVFPTLRKLAKFGGLNDVRIDSIDANLKYKEQRLELTEIHAASQDQIRVEGSGAITPNRLDGDLVIGLSPKILGWIPGAEDKVFVDQRDGLRWAKVTISGSPSRPREDLTQRLVAAFRDKMTKEFNGDTKDAVKSLLDMFHQ
jgi:hypothetical protein